jgi:hypothetical protein
MTTKFHARLRPVFWPPSLASADDYGRILVACACVTGHLHGVAVLRGLGISETTLTGRVEALVSTKRWPDRLKVRLPARVRPMFVNSACDVPFPK